MKFQTAVAALVAIENLSLVNSQEIKSLGESVWKDVIEVVSDNGKMMRERTNHLQDKLQKLSTTGEHQLGGKGKQPSLRSSTSDGDAVDLGILVPNPVKNEQREIPQAGTPIQTKKEYKGKNPLRLNLPAATGEKALRSLQYYEAVNDVDTYDISDLFANPLANSINQYCGYMVYLSEKLGTEVCDVCGVTYPEDPETGLPGNEYTLSMDCPNLPYSTYTAESLQGLADACGRYCDTCNVDVENFVVDLQGCYIEVPDIDFADAFNTPIAFVGNVYCPYLDEQCEVCEIIYGDDDDAATYSLNMDCPNVKDEDLAEAQEVFVGLNDLCMACQTCSVDSENLIATMQDCSFQDYLGDIIDGYLGDIEGVIDADPGIAYYDFGDIPDADLGDLDGILDEIIDADPEIADVDLGDIEGILDEIVDADPEIADLDLGDIDEIIDEIIDADPETATDAIDSDIEPASEAEPATEAPVEAEPASDTSDASSLSETSGCYSFGRKSTTVGFVMLTMATASAVQILLG
jgi:hypothetical protein